MENWHYQAPYSGTPQGGIVSPILANIVLNELDHFVQAYAVEKAKQEARHRGHSTTEQTLPDGSIKLTIQVAGGVA